MAVAELELADAVASAMTGQIPDIARLREQRGANNQGFTVTMFAMAEAGRCLEALRLLIARIDGWPADEPFADPDATRFLSAHQAILDRRYGLIDAARYLRRLGEAIETGDLADVHAQSLLMLNYMNYLQFLIAVEIPWHELGVAFEGVRTINGALQDRMVAAYP
jgi:hypothetical protein